MFLPKNEKPKALQKVWHNPGVQSTVILWRGRSLEPVQCCRSFGPSTSRPHPEPWRLGHPRKIERARPLSGGGQKEHRSVRANGGGGPDARERTNLSLVVVNGRVLFAAQIWLLESRDGSVNSRCFCCTGDYRDYHRFSSWMRLLARCNILCTYLPLVWGDPFGSNLHTVF